MKRIAAVAVAVLAVTACGVQQTQAAAPVTSGTGFKLMTKYGINALSPSTTYTVTFNTQQDKDQFAPYLSRSITQLKDLGVKIAVGGVETVNPAVCPPKGHIQFLRMYRPLARGGTSQGVPCKSPADSSVYSGMVAIDSEIMDGSWYMTEPMRHNTFPHEMGHALGLDHPNTDLDKDGVVEDGECVATSYANKPTMCSPSGGYSTATNEGKYLAYDLNGYKALLANAKLLNIK